jgi:hypothetical protein
MISQGKAAMKINERLLAELQPAREALETWRQTRKHRQPIPTEVWDKIVPLARAHGINPVSTALRLNYDALRRRLQGPKAPARSLPASPSFVEVRTPEWIGAESGWLAELEDARGRKMKLRLGAARRADMLALVQAFWRACPPIGRRAGR